MSGTEAHLRLDIPARFAGVRLDRALNELVPGHTRSQLQKLVRRGRVKLNGRKVIRSNVFLRGGEQLFVRFDEVPLELTFIHVEESFAVADKPPGMITHWTERHTSGTVADHAVAHLGPLPSVDDAIRPGIVHRLDRETSGIMVLARTPEALDELREQFRSRSVEKTYIALVHGVPAHDSFVVDKPLGAVRGQKDLQGVDPYGREALTEFSVLERFEHAALLECWPRTGRRHQIRVHLWTIGHPIVADKLYRPKSDVALASDTIKAFKHHALHAQSLRFFHPASEAPLEYSSPLPAPFEQILKQLRNTRGA